MTHMDLHNYLVPQLRKIAKEHGVTGTSKMRKTELMDAIVNAHQAAVQERTGCPNPWHASAPAREKMTCPECPQATTITSWGTDEDEPVVFSNDTIEEEQVEDYAKTAAEAAYVGKAVRLRAGRGTVAAVTVRATQYRTHTGYEFLMVIKHEGKVTRTLHGLNDIQFV